MSTEDSAVEKLEADLAQMPEAAQRFISGLATQFDDIATRHGLLGQFALMLASARVIEKIEQEDL